MMPGNDAGVYLANINADGSPAPWQVSIYRLFSFWDMKDFAASYFWRVARHLSSFREWVRLPPHEELTEKDLNFWQRHLPEVEQACREMGLKVSAAGVTRLRRLLTSQPQRAHIIEALQDLERRIEDELKELTFLYVSREQAAYYTTPRQGWEEIIARFPTTEQDIEEAGKCFALNRNGAAVFYSLQVVEAGLIALGQVLRIADPKSGWTAVAHELKRVVMKKYEDRTDFEKQYGEALEQVQGTVEALKNAWRNKVSHVQGRFVLMTREFSPEVAEEILLASRAFMRRLATELPIEPPQ